MFLIVLVFFSIFLLLFTLICCIQAFEFTLYLLYSIRFCFFFVVFVKFHIHGVLVWKIHALHACIEHNQMLFESIVFVVLSSFCRCYTVFNIFIFLFIFCCFCFYFSSQCLEHRHAFLFFFISSSIFI